MFQTFRHGFPHQPTAVAFDPIQRLLAIGTKSGSLRMYPFFFFFFFYTLIRSIWSGERVLVNKNLVDKSWFSFRFPQPPSPSSLYSFIHFTTRRLKINNYKWRKGLIYLQIIGKIFFSSNSNIIVLWLIHFAYIRIKKGKVFKFIFLITFLDFWSWEIFQGNISFGMMAD